MNIVQELLPVTIHAGEIVNILIDKIEKSEVGHVRCMPFDPPPSLIWMPYIDRVVDENGDAEYSVKLRLSNSDRVAVVEMAASSWAFEIAPLLQPRRSTRPRPIKPIDFSKPLEAGEFAEAIDGEVVEELPTPASGGESSNILVTADSEVIS